MSEPKPHIRLSFGSSAPLMHPAAAVCLQDVSQRVEWNGSSAQSGPPWAGEKGSQGSPTSDPESWDEACCVLLYCHSVCMESYWEFQSQAHYQPGLVLLSHTLPVCPVWLFQSWTGVWSDVVSSQRGSSGSGLAEAVGVGSAGVGAAPLVLSPCPSSASSTVPAVFPSLFPLKTFQGCHPGTHLPPKHRGLRWHRFKYYLACGLHAV